MEKLEIVMCNNALEVEFFVDLDEKL